MPRLLDRSFHEISRPEPASLALEMNLKGLSTATMTLPGTPAIETGDFLELFTQQGSAGIFRVEQIEQDYPTATRLSLKHSLVTLADSRCVLAQPGAPQSAPALFREILAQQTLWQCGAVEAPETLLVTPEGGGSLLEAMDALMEALPDYHLAFDHSTTPWTLHMRNLTDACATECRLTRNLSSLRLETDRSRLCTQLFLPGIAEPLVADTADRWGIVSGQLSASSQLSEEELRALGQQYLERHKNPQVTITMEAIDLCRLTDATLDAFHLGGLCRVCLPGGEAPLLQRLVCLSWPDVYGTPEVIHVSLSTAAKSASTLLSGLMVDTTRVKKQVIRQWDEMALQKELLIAAQEQITLLSQNITLHATEMLTLRAGLDDASAEITLLDGRITANADAITLKADQASLELANQSITANAKAIALKADQASLDLANQSITANANAIALKADQASLNLANQNISANAKAIALKADQASLNLANQNISANAKAIALKADQSALTLANNRIDAQASAIALKADKIDLQGYVTADALESEVMSIMTDADIQGNLWVEGTLNAMYIQGTKIYGDVEADAVTIGGLAAATQSWVSGRGYATQSWVNNKGYITQADLNTAINNVNNWVLDKFATKIWCNATFQPKA